MSLMTSFLNSGSNSGIAERIDSSFPPIARTCASEPEVPNAFATPLTVS
eukprot:CAMPEP_0174737146 /NCGR_PEP_ID=MMETSP1094-20130205/67852_1 /TAXON_ID=156173 /ORGANISM="Chrysochromulina brevifilum, Strain UTEX LB 985" /LENGTH=48 /DNA_ID= /DNA_START= /DNA_END= /DNA_ORIENTATION=